MNPVLNRLSAQLTDVRNSSDQQLLDRFLTARDETAFAELVRRYGPVVWGACRRRLASRQDAEDAFQAAFLVLVRRANHLRGDAPLGPWLYRVAVLTAGDLIRGNQRRAAVCGPMGYDVPAPEPEPAAEKLDLDAALLALPERERGPVVLCHLQGLTRREAAERLGCPEGTLSARLNRALKRLRARLGATAPAAVLSAVVLAVPTELVGATVRSATIDSCSTLTTVGVSPVVVGLTDGVLRMFWMKKVMTAAVIAVLVVGAGVLALGTTGWAGSSAGATEPGAANAPLAPAEEPDPLKRLEKRLADLEKQKQLLDATLEDLKAEKQKLESSRKEREAAAAAAELGKDIAVDVAAVGHAPAFTVREVVNGRVAEVSCSNLDVLTVYLTRALNDPKGPKKLRISAHMGHPADQLRRVFAACASAGYTKAAFSQTADPHSRYTYKEVATKYYVEAVTRPSSETPKSGEIDLTKYASPKKP
jgi:RNA polymerase sigma factor (sigma-70 family)